MNGKMNLLQDLGTILHNNSVVVGSVSTYIRKRERDIIVGLTKSITELEHYYFLTMHSDWSIGMVSTNFVVQLIM